MGEQIAWKSRRNLSHTVLGDISETFESRSQKYEQQKMLVKEIWGSVWRCVTKTTRCVGKGRAKEWITITTTATRVFSKTKAGVAYHKFKLQLLEEMKGSVWGWVTTETGPIANWDKATWVNETMLENANLDFWNSDSTTCVLHRETLKPIVIPPEWDIKIMLLRCGPKITIMLFVC